MEGTRLWGRNPDSAICELCGVRQVSHPEMDMVIIPALWGSWEDWRVTSCRVLRPGSGP